MQDFAFSSQFPGSASVCRHKAQAAAGQASPLKEQEAFIANDTALKENLADGAVIVFLDAARRQHNAG